MIFDIGIACVAGGGLMIVFAFVANFVGIHGQIKNAVSEMTTLTKTKAATAGAASESGLAASQAQAASAIVKDYLEGLSGLADKLSKLTPSVAALVVSTILFGFGTALAAIDYLH